jgi:GNAT superfamily N-acetyltransferase
VTPEPRLATAADTGLVASVAARGFAADPVMSWVFPDASTRQRQLEMAFWGMTRRALGWNWTVHLMVEQCVSLWAPPGGGSPTEEPDSGGPNGFDEGVLERFAILQAAMAAHHPAEEHWYLAVAATAPEWQGQGLGARILAPVLAECDRAGLPAYLESTNPRNLAFYRRLGFAEAGEIPLPGGPSLYPMWRG